MIRALSFTVSKLQNRQLTSKKTEHFSRTEKQSCDSAVFSTKKAQVPAFGHRVGWSKQIRDLVKEGRFGLSEGDIWTTTKWFNEGEWARSGKVSIHLCHDSKKPNTLVIHRDYGNGKSEPINGGDVDTSRKGSSIILYELELKIKEHLTANKAKLAECRQKSAG